ncbi:MAG: protein kinase domain-containing protein [Bradymonadaceae bacterium]
MSVVEAKEVQEVIKGRYAHLEELGRGGQAHTYRARDLERDVVVAVKELCLRRVESWKGIGLFEREAAALAQLDHPAIPAYIDAFHIEEGVKERFFLVQTFISGENLEVLIDKGLRFDEVEARAFAVDMLEILAYRRTRRSARHGRRLRESSTGRRVPKGAAFR